MKSVKAAIFLIGIGCVMVVYAHTAFVTKDFFGLVIKRLDRIEKKIDNLGR